MDSYASFSKKVKPYILGNFFDSIDLNDSLSVLSVVLLPLSERLGLLISRLLLHVLSVAHAALGLIDLMNELRRR